MEKVTEYSEKIGAVVPGGGFSSARVIARDDSPFIKITAYGQTVTLSFGEASKLIRFINSMEIVWGPRMLEKFK